MRPRRRGDGRTIRRWRIVSLFLLEPIAALLLSRVIEGNGWLGKSTGADEVWNVVITDPEDPKFDAEKLIAKYESAAK